MSNANLPAWAKPIAKGRVEIDPNGFYPAFFKELGVVKKDINQYWLTVGMQCAKWDVQRAIAGTDDAPQLGGALVLLAKDCPAWKMDKFPKGKGADAAKKGGGAKQHYLSIRPGLF